MIIEINKLSIKPFSEEGSIDFTDDESFKCVKPLLEIKSNHVKIEAMRYEDFIRVVIDVKALLSLESSYCLKPFDYELATSDEFHFSTNKNDDEECILVNGNKINLDEYVFELICSSIPLSPKMKGEKLPSGGDGYNVYSEDDYNKLKDAETDSRFDKLKDIDI